MPAVPPYLDLRKRLTLESFDQNQIAGTGIGDDLLEGQFRIAAKLAHQGKAPGRGQATWRAPASRILNEFATAMVDLELGMGMLDDRDAMATPVSSLISATISVVLPEFFQPTTPNSGGVIEVAAPGARCRPLRAPRAG